uniref:Retrotransposon Copia-like N-terminal domain-containing protein n=1 Tax=Cajanus cajan TaxID=3821 RepID=A0A151RFK6_CAJCA|nr:hypothetical protein KK1_037336 [Cajanus cajan]
MNPFHLHGNENPSQSLVSSPLMGPNYHAWARAMRLALMPKNKLKLVDGSIIPPVPTDSTYGAWERSNIYCSSAMLAVRSAT